MIKALEEEVEEISEENFNDPLIGTTRRKQIYERHVPIFLQNAKPVVGKVCYLHSINMQLIEPVPEILSPRHKPIIDPANTSRGLGLLCTSKLPPVNSFPVFTKYGKILVEIVLGDEAVMFSERELQAIEEFHKFIFSDALWLEKGKMFSPNDAPCSYFILPVDKSSQNKLEIDWDFIQTAKNHIYHEQKNNFKKLSPNSFNKNIWNALNPNCFNENIFNDAVLMRSYMMHSWDTVRPTFHHVVKIQKNLSPISIMDLQKNRTFKDYYLETYKIIINNEDQFLIETKKYAKLNNLWKPAYISLKEKVDDLKTLSNTKLKKMKYSEYLIPELCIIHPFPSSFFHKIMCLPTILFRLNSLLLAEEIRQSVGEEMNIGTIEHPQWPAFRFETSDRELRKHLFKEGIIKNEQLDNLFIPQDILKNGKYISSFLIHYNLENLQGPSPSLLLKAMTAKRANDEFDLERLELIGDSFLKYAISLKIFLKYLKFDEGKLTILRSKLIQNRYLYRKAEKKKLAQFLITVPFDCNSTWLPPCYLVSEDNDQQGFIKQEISDKTIADSVEALIGAYLLSSGPVGALKFIHWLGINPLLSETDNFNDWPPLPHNPLLQEVLDEKLIRLTSGFDRFETKIKYTFRNKAYLLQAFTHPSYYENDITDCYQRLEFLGDSILDFMITRQLYEDPNDLYPGQLTDLRAALVNNSFFASLAVYYEYDKFLLMLSPTLFKLINQYVEMLRNNQAFQHFKKHQYFLEENECFDLDELEVPKALGDLFESVAGAIYLDSGMSLDTVWKVYFPMIRPSLAHLSQYVPKPPIRELYEMDANIKFGEVLKENGKTCVTVTLSNGKEYKGIGLNKKTAKRSAAKRAVLDLKDTKAKN